MNTISAFNMKFILDQLDKADTVTSAVWHGSRPGETLPYGLTREAALEAAAAVRIIRDMLMHAAVSDVAIEPAAQRAIAAE